MADQQVELIAELKDKIIKTLDLEGELTPEEIGDDERRVGGDPGIDSIDVLEIVVMLEKDYGILIDNKELGEKVFSTIGALATFVADNRKAEA
jgi:acyl carrier protein